MQDNNLTKSISLMLADQYKLVRHTRTVIHKIKVKSFDDNYDKDECATTWSQS